jgi:hypothetical protein
MMNIEEFMLGYQAAWEGRDPLRSTAGSTAGCGTTFAGSRCSVARIWWHSLPQPA